MELGEMRLIDGFVTKDAVNTEIFRGLKPVLGEFVQHARRHGRGVRSQQILLGLGQLPVVPVPLGPGLTKDPPGFPRFVGPTDPLQVRRFPFL